MAMYSAPGQYNGISGAGPRRGGTGRSSDPNDIIQQQLYEGSPRMGQNPYQGGYDQLIQQLQQSAQNPQMAAMEYNQANTRGLNNLMQMSHGRSPGAARAASQQMGQMNQGLAQGQAMASLQEQMAARQGLAGVLGGASQADFMRQQANQQAYLDMLKAKLGQPTGFQQAAQLGMGIGSLAMLA